VAFQWIAFAIQVMIAISFEVADDLTRGFWTQRGTAEGIRDARNLVSFEVSHGLWVEPAWQQTFLQTRHFLAFSISWIDMAHLMNGVYILGHVFVTLSVACWVYFYRRQYFVLMRNTVMLTNALALVVYETFPVAPPRLTSGLIWDGHDFAFQDTVFGVFSNGRMLSRSLSYNEFSALPSVHIAWAIIAAAAVILLARAWPIKVVASLYPVLMLIAVVVTGNHFILDAAASVPVVLAAALIAVGLSRLPGSDRWPTWVRQYVVGGGG
jgi:hypothetical protein